MHRYLIFIPAIMLLTLLANSRTPTLTVLNGGKVVQVQYESKKTQRIPLSLPQGMDMEGDPLFFGDDQFAVVVVVAADIETATSMLIAVQADKGVLWTVDLETFNPSAPLIESDAVYVAGFDKVMKLSRTDGKVLWSKERLYDDPRYRFNGGGLIRRQGDLILVGDKLKFDAKNGTLRGDQP